MKRAENTELTHLVGEALATDTNTDEYVIQEHLKTVAPEVEHLLRRADRGAVGKQHVQKFVRQSKHYKGKNKQYGKQKPGQKVFLDNGVSENAQNNRDNRKHLTGYHKADE